MIDEKDSIIQRFNRIVKQVPHKIAIREGDQILTYAELDAKSNVLAEMLISQGVKPGVVVSVLLKQSLNGVLAIVGILKSGAAYLPIDPYYPQERIDFILNNSGAAFLVTDNAHQGMVTTSTDVIIIDNVREQESFYMSQPELKYCATDLMYVIYTSGSTGIPKGVEIEHKGILNLVDWYHETFDSTQQDESTLYASPAFDASVFEIWPTLLIGAYLNVVPSRVRLNYKKLVQWLYLREISITLVPTVMAEKLLLAEWPNNIPLRWLLTGGDQLRYYSKPNFNFNVANLYGPTENSVATTCYIMPKRPITRTQMPPIGRAIRNHSLYILDKNFQPVPRGQKGLLYVGGVGLARGYRNRPDLTRKHFKLWSDPKKPNACKERIYCTGDLVRQLADGNLAFIGRNDHQVKIRGYRIELGEIEAALCRYESVVGAVVQVLKYENGHQSIGAHLAINGSKPKPTTSAIQQHVAALLPDYMVPDQMKFVQEFPLTANQKIDRETLLQDFKRPTDVTTISQNPLNLQIRESWQEILQHTRVLPNDKFFEIGGDSLNAEELTLQLETKLKIQLPVGFVYEYPTLSTQLHFIETLNQLQPKKIDTLTIPNMQLAIERSEQCLAIPSEAKTILLTGASGFLGIHFLEKLLLGATATVVCLVRGSNRTQALNRLKNCFDHYQLNMANPKRLDVIPGDLSLPNLGLQRATYHKLAATVDIVFHLAAEVNYNQTVAQLTGANILGTQRIVEFCATQRIKPLHYVSTLDVFGDLLYSNSEFSLGENRDIENLKPYLESANGYAQSKWYAERIIVAARQQNLPAFIYRTGQIMGSKKVGVIPTSFFVARFIKSVIQLGFYPKLGTQRAFLVAADDVSEFLFELSNVVPHQELATFHIVPAATVDYTMEQLLKLVADHGYRIQPKPHQEWLHLLTLEHGDSHDNALGPFLRQLQNQPLAIEESNLIDISTANTESLVGRPVPHVSQDNITKHLQRLSQETFLPMATV